MHKPWHSLLFAIIVFIAFGLLSFLFPKNGIALSTTASLNFPSLASLFETNTEKKDISKLIAQLDNIDTLINLNDTLKTKTDSVLTKDTVKHLITALQYKNKAVLANFFEALSHLKSNPKSIRVLHYGDSQIEGDRITDYLRLKLQSLFGGSGVGLISLVPVAPSISTKVTYNSNWDRYGIFVSKDKRVKHNNYGVLAGFNRFANYKNVNDSSNTINSEVKITTTKLGGSNTTAYKKLKLFYGGSQTKTWCEFYDGPALVSADSLEAGGFLLLKEYNVGQGSLTHQFKFKGKDSPDFYGVSLESDNGVLVDNIGLRGSSGTFFHQINFAQLKQFYDYLNVKLVILQFGGNVMPGIKSEKMATNYANYLRNQISIVKKAAPNASIIFIGPADMSVKEGTDYVTHPYLEATRDAIKKVALESDCAFFDMYDCMGGKNSMPVWVEEKIAATDYIHFSPQGARKIATLFYASLINEYNSYLKNK